ncbi:Dipeptidyl peptidase family member 6 [Trichinella murrelli]|uniref:Dipeptidyl peptidase family member 6 n=1 Tax=Trichinella murrelli TaxID=144512 RepID=A0A0V0UI73_9BILA|nr:Dipeptidyl peptidase family member 6 [Trichinella murrelli]
MNLVSFLCQRVASSLNCLNNVTPSCTILSSFSTVALTGLRKKAILCPISISLHFHLQDFLTNLFFKKQVKLFFELEYIIRAFCCQQLLHLRVMSTKRKIPYGLWKSPITSSFITSVTCSLVELRIDPSESGKGIVYWNERRANERGRCVVCSRIFGGKIVEWTPRDYSVRTTAHDYGGGSFFVYAGCLYFSNYADQRLYKQSAPNQAPIPLTPSGKSYRYADGCFAHNSIYCVREDTSENPAKDAIVRIDLTSQAQTIIAEGADFYCSPKVSPDGKAIVWMQWNFPNMPWDVTELWMADLNAEGNIQTGTDRKIVFSETVNYMQPRFCENGELYFISDESEWWNLYKYSDIGTHKNLVLMEKEIGGPHWQFADDAYSFDCTGSGDIALIIDQELHIVNRKSELCYKQDTGYHVHSHVAYGRDRCIYCIATSATKFQAIIRWNVLRGETEVIYRVHEELDQEIVSLPHPITFPVLAEDAKDKDAVAHGYFYNPQNPKFEGICNYLPPLLVLAHGGPTARASTGLDLRIQYYTSRGFAVLNVDYRGSTGYGTKYRNTLKSKLGVYDVDDCCAGAIYLVNEGKVDSQRLCISGRSAGGFIVLAALAFQDVFNAGCCHYGISDLVALQESSCKFELKYFDQLIAPYPEGKEIYQRRSPINYIDDIDKPVAFFHGDEDPIVPVNQIKEMYRLLGAKGVDTSLTVFKGEGHGYRINENIRRAIDEEFNFFCQALRIREEKLSLQETVSDLMILKWTHRPYSLVIIVFVWKK